MAQRLITTCAGLYQYQNDLSEVPDGAMFAATNCVVRRNGIIEARRGRFALPGTFGTSGHRSRQLITYGADLINHYGTPASETSLARFVSPSSWGAYTGSFAAPVTDSPTGTRMRWVSSNKNLYITTSGGVYKIDSATVTPTLSGVPKGLDGRASLTGNSGFLNGNCQVAYRVLWGIKDTNGNLILGAPSGRVILIDGESTAAIAGMARTGGNLVTVTTSAAHGYTSGQTVVMDSNRTPQGETDFPAGQFSITVTGGSVFTYTQTGANVSSTAVHRFSRIADAKLIINIPSGITSSHFYQVYRSAQSVGSTVAALDELSLVWEAAPPVARSVTNLSRAGTTVTATTSVAHGFTVDQTVNLTSGSPHGDFPVGLKKIIAVTSSTFDYTEAGAATSAAVTYTATPIDVVSTDSIIDALRQSALYTNPTQDGILQANDQPPLCRDLALFKGSTWFANTTSKHRLTLTLMSVSGTEGIAIDDTVTIAGTTYTAKATESVTSRHFELFTTGSATQNISDTVASLIRVINANTANTTVYSYYLAGPTDVPGIFLVEERSIGGGPFAVTVSAHGNAWEPALPTSGTTVSSSADRLKSGLYYSKALQPEAVPLLNNFRIGADDKHIKRVVPTRDSLFVFKDDGLFRITGDDTNSFRVDSFDLTVDILGPETVQILSNAIYCWTTNGVQRVTDTGAAIISRPIENSLIRELFREGYGSQRFNSFAATSELDQEYMLAIAYGDDPGTQDGKANRIYVYNAITQAWVDWTLDATSGIFWQDSPNGPGVSLGITNTNQVTQERHANDYTDFADYSVAATITEINVDGVSTRIKFSAEPTYIAGNLVVGDVVSKGGINAVVTAIVSTSPYVVNTTSSSFTTGAAVCFQSYDVRMEWAPAWADNPSTIKHFREIQFLYDAPLYYSASFAALADLDAVASGTVTFDGVAAGFFASWPAIAGEPGQNPKSIRTYFPREASRGSRVRIIHTFRQAYLNPTVLGVAITYEPGSERNKR